MNVLLSCTKRDRGRRNSGAGGDLISITARKSGAEIEHVILHVMAQYLGSQVHVFFSAS